LADLVGGGNGRAGHRYDGSSKGRGRSSRGNPSSAPKGCHPRIGLVHFTAETAEASRSGFADAFEFGTHLAATGRGKPDADTLLCHHNISLVGHTSFPMETRSY